MIERINWKKIGYCAKHQAPLLTDSDHGCYVCRAQLSAELIEYLKQHDDGKRAYREIEQEFWRFRTGKLLEEDLLAPKKRDVKPDASLSLLVIDLGDSCVVKVESGKPPQTLIYIGKIGDVYLYPSSFTGVRSAIDAMDEKPPVPRIERPEPQLKDGALVIKSGGAFQYYLSPEVFEALEKLAGAPLPIYEPKRGGEWKQVFYGIGENIVKIKDAPAVNIWRYTRGL